MQRNRARFPENFCFQLSDEEVESLRSQIATLEKKYKLEVPICHLKPERKKFKVTNWNLKQKLDSIFTFCDIISLKNYRERNQILC